MTDIATPVYLSVISYFAMVETMSQTLAGFAEACPEPQLHEDLQEFAKILENACTQGGNLIKQISAR